MEIYNQLKTPPPSALKPIRAGRLKGFTDISPQWRIEIMTEIFGPVGIGWYYEITKQETIEADSRVGMFIDINLFVKVDGEWSKPIHGSGGSMLLAQESKGLYYSDESKKMAITDALGVAIKLLGGGADIYRGYSDSKNIQNKTSDQAVRQEAEDSGHAIPNNGKRMEAKFPGRCAETGNDISKGEDIYYLDGKVYCQSSKRYQGA